MLPPLGENVENGTISKILVSQGDTIQADDPVLELETDKAVLEVPSTVSGVVSEIAVEEGQTVNVGD
ncbi:MAG: biotin/lipoyl-containing protein, partial [Candidatus Hydrogenedentota bacterium]